jgi:hypothetical protein
MIPLVSKDYRHTSAARYEHTLPVIPYSLTDHEVTSNHYYISPVHTVTVAESD